MAETMPSPPSSPITSNLEQSTIPPPFPGRPPAMADMDTMGNVPSSNGKTLFDIVATYKSLLASDPDVTMPVAAIEALVLLLSQLPPTLSTISETLDVIHTSTALLKRSVPNPISLSAGTDLFQRYLITTLQRGSNLNGSGSDFKAIRQHLLSNSRLFVKRAKEARHTIASYGRRFVREGSVVLTNGGSRVVGAVLEAAAAAQTLEGGSPRFKVIYVQSASSPLESSRIIRSLRQLSVPVATIPESAVAYSMGKVSMVLVGAEGVVENGGIISRIGTYQMGILAKSMRKPVYVVAESHKFVRMFPLGQYDLPIQQKLLDFRTDIDEEARAGSVGPQNSNEQCRKASLTESERWVEQTPAVIEHSEYFDKVDNPEDSQNTYLNTNNCKETQGGPKSKEPTLHVSNTQDAAVDYTPPDLLTALITESGVHTPSAVSEELIKIWY